MKKLFLIILFFIIPYAVHSEILPKDAKNEDISDFSGGLNTNTSPYKLKKNESPNMSNVIIDDHDGRLNTVGGYKVIGSTPTLSKINFIYEYKDINNAKTYVVSDSQKVLSTKDFQSYNLLIAGLNSNALISAVEVQYKLWMTNGQDPVFTFDGSSVVVLDGKNYSGVQTPNVPRGKYINFYQGKIWVYNNINNTSALYFTDLVSTNNVSIAPDHYLAWNPENQLNVGYGDGQNGTAIWIYRGQLFAGKDHSIYTINGTDKYSYQWVKTDSKIGISGQDSLDILDNYTYIKAKNDGIYAFNGNTSERLTDPIEPDMDSVSSNDSRLVNSVWETNDDFFTGKIDGSTVTNGFITILTTPNINSTPFPITGDSGTDIPFGMTGACGSPWNSLNNWLFGTYPANSTSSINFVQLTTMAIIPSNTFGGYLKTFSVCVNNAQYNDLDINNIVFTFKNSRTGDLFSREIVPPNALHPEYPKDQYNDYGGGDRVYFINANKFSGISTFPVTSDDVVNGRISIKTDYQSVSGLSGLFLISSMTMINHSQIQINNKSGTYTSNVTTVSSVTSWDSFNSINNTNGGTIQFYYRSSSTVNGVYASTVSWKPIVEGAVINSSSTDHYIQWSSSINLSGYETDSPEIDNVVISHNEGGANDSRPIFNHWRNRLWVAVSTDNAGTLIYVKSKNTNSNPNAWMRLDGIRIKSLLNDGEYFYAGSSTSGIILRLDYGTNFNGSAIRPYYETPDLDMGNPFFKKDILKYYFDVEKQSGKTLRIGTSKDGGAWSYKDISCSGSGRLLREINNVPYSNGKYFRIRFENNDLDKDIGVNNFSIIYKDSQADTVKASE